MVRDEDDGLLDAPPEEGWSEDPARLLEDAPILSMFMFLEYFLINRYVYVCMIFNMMYRPVPLVLRMMRIKYRYFRQMSFLFFVY